ncbi:MAG: hypothetical protein LBE62_12980 [Azonexus sp.]|jgi:hypothetical protein|nr:hypothetical protein [Azonexus sp.]
MNLIRLDHAPAVFTPYFVERIREASDAIRQLRRMGCRVFAVDYRDHGHTHIEIDHNPHLILKGCPDVWVTCRAAAGRVCHQHQPVDL